MLNGKTVLITGGTGSFGNHFTEYVLKHYKPKKIIIYSRDEFKQFNMANKFKQYEDIMRFFIGDVRDKERLLRALGGVDYVIHAAALKQVPACEYNPIEAVRTTFISKIPSFKIIDLAQAMLPGCEMPEVGIREGEKLHEVMVTREDSATTYEYKKHYIIYPHYNWWGEEKLILGGKKVEEGFEYNSGNNSVWLSAKEISSLLNKM